MQYSSLVSRLRSGLQLATKVSRKGLGGRKIEYQVIETLIFKVIERFKRP
jgi:hypothetical protein